MNTVPRDGTGLFLQAAQVAAGKGTFMNATRSSFRCESGGLGRRPRWLGGPLVVFAWSVGTAHAECPRPTELECYQNPADQSSYFHTECGAEEWAAMKTDPASVCNQLIVARSDYARPETNREGPIAVPSEMQPLGTDDDYISLAEIAPFDPTLDPVQTRDRRSFSSNSALNSQTQVDSQWESATSSAGELPQGMSISGDVGVLGGGWGGPSSPFDTSLFAAFPTVSGSTTIDVDTARASGATQGASSLNASTQVGPSLEPKATAPYRARQDWARNGNQVTSCDEYVYERYYDYSLYEDDAAVLGTNYRALFDRNYSRLADGVQSRAGKFVAKIPEDRGLVEKNLFFTYRPTYPPGAQPYQFRDPDLLARLEAGRTVYAHTVGWHGFMSDVLTQPGQAERLTQGARVATLLGEAPPSTLRDDLLYALADQQRNFARLLAKRDAVLKRWIDWLHAVGGSDRPCNPIEVPPSSYLKPFDKVVNPADLVYGVELKDYYGGAVYQTLLADSPKSSTSLPANTAQYSSPEQAYFRLLADAQAELAMNSADVAARASIEAIQSWVMNEDGAPTEGGSSTATDAVCAQFLAPDELPARMRYSCGGTPVILKQCASFIAEAVAKRLREIDEKEIEPAFDGGALWLSRRRPT